MVSLLCIYLIVFALHLGLPGLRVTGYARGTDGERLRYRLNGLAVLVVMIAGFALVTSAGLVPVDFIYRERVAMLATACAVGLVFTAAVVLPAPRTGKSLLAELYLGRLENPQWLGGRVDAKMLLYLIGAVMLDLLVLSFAAHHRAAWPDDPSPGVTIYAALLTFFVTEYLVFERVHLYTYDFVAERVGFKLGWGCLVFYPFFYGVGLWYAADQPNPHTPTWMLVVSVALFFGGWLLARGANLQKYYFKTRPEQTTFGPFTQRALAAGEQRLLIGGFWGVSRHVNYLGELAMATGLTLCLGYPRAFWPWLYPLYYIALLVPRQIDDDKRCAQKYGALWAEYCRAVPYRIVPFVY